LCLRHKHFSLLWHDAAFIFTKEVGMPWVERDRMSLREEFVHMAETQQVSMTELCERFQISRKTGYKWVGRLRTEGAVGLTDRSRRPHQVNYHVPEATRAFLVAERRRHPAWGARKLRQRAQTQGLLGVLWSNGIGHLETPEAYCGPGGE
jgi:transposase